mgnify:CR=1 FL=1
MFNDKFERFLAIEDNNYKKQRQQRNKEKVKQEMFNMPFI